MNPQAGWFLSFTWLTKLRDISRPEPNALAPGSMAFDVIPTKPEASAYGSQCEALGLEVPLMVTVTSETCEHIDEK